MITLTQTRTFTNSFPAFLTRIDVNDCHSDVDEDGDVTMKAISPHLTQFTQTLLLFVRYRYFYFFCRSCISSHRFQSQTQSGKTYTPQLTRFYASVGPGVLLPLIEEALTDLRVKFKPAEQVKDKSNPDRGLVQIRIGGYDQRKLMFKGYVKLENFKRGQYSGTFCVMYRDQVSHLAVSW